MNSILGHKYLPFPSTIQAPLNGTVSFEFSKGCFGGPQVLLGSLD